MSGRFFFVPPGSKKHQKKENAGPHLRRPRVAAGPDQTVEEPAACPLLPQTGRMRAVRAVSSGVDAVREKAGDDGRVIAAHCVVTEATKGGESLLPLFPAVIVCCNRNWKRLESVDSKSTAADIRMHAIVGLSEVSCPDDLADDAEEGRRWRTWSSKWRKMCPARRRRRRRAPARSAAGRVQGCSPTRRRGGQPRRDAHAPRPPHRSSTW